MIAVDLVRAGVFEACTCHSAKKKEKHEEVNIQDQSVLQVI
jgi:hypothetical protein